MAIGTPKLLSDQMHGLEHLRRLASPSTSTRPAVAHGNRDEFAGVFDATVYPDGYLDELRREWP